MSQNQRHRGADPEDERSFGVKRWPALREATGDLCWLLDRGYGIASARELVGDRYALTRRQRMAVARCACSTQARQRRSAHRVEASQLRDQELWIDALNVLTITEAALGGGVILIGRDGCCRDVAGIYRRYDKVEETVPALRRLGELMAGWGVRKCRWWVDSPVDNSGRVKAFILEVGIEAGWPWEVELVLNPDRVLSETTEIVCSSDHVILDRCERWFNLTQFVIKERVPNARIVDLGNEADP